VKEVQALEIYGGLSKKTCTTGEKASDCVRFFYNILKGLDSYLKVSDTITTKNTRLFFPNSNLIYFFLFMGITEGMRIVQSNIAEQQRSHSK
jgi:hypothetical protein